MFKYLLALAPRRQQLMVLLVPTITFFGSLAALIPACERYQRAKRQLERQRGEIAELIRNLPKPDNKRTYFVRNDARESTMFVREITAIARGSDCALTAFSAPGALDAAGATKGATDAPWYVTPVTVQISLVGTYPNVRRFLAGVVNSRRMYSVTGLDLRARWNAADGALDHRVNAQIRVDRYLAMRARPSGKVTTHGGDESIPGLK